MRNHFVPLVKLVLSFGDLYDLVINDEVTLAVFGVGGSRRGLMYAFVLFRYHFRSPMLERS